MTTLKDLYNEKPTKLWRDRMLEYEDEPFDEERLSDSDKLLDDFLNKLLLVQDTKDQMQIMKAVEEVVIAFNELDERNEYFIYTMEREELAEFIDQAARLAGLEVEDGQDITEEWREW